MREKNKGGIAIMNVVRDEMKIVLSDCCINNANVTIRQPGATADDLNVIEGNRVYNLPSTYSVKSTSF